MNIAIAIYFASIAIAILIGLSRIAFDADKMVQEEIVKQNRAITEQREKYLREKPFHDRERLRNMYESFRIHEQMGYALPEEYWIKYLEAYGFPPEYIATLPIKRKKP